MPESATSPPRPPRRRRLALSLRGLMLLVLIVGVPLGWKIQRARVQTQAVARIEAAGGIVTYNFEFNGEYPYRQWAESRAPGWLRRAIGDEYFQEVTAVHFLSTGHWTGDDLAAIDDLDHLFEISTFGRPLTTEDLARLGRSKTLRFISLHAADVDDVGLALLAGATHLRKLSLAGSNDRVTDAGMASLRGLAELRDFTVISDLITGPGLAHLAALPGLRELRLPASKVNDAGLAHLARMNGLRVIDLSSVPITDAGLENLKGLTALEELNLRGILDLTDAGLVSLRGMKNLRKLDLSGTMITDAGLSQLVGLEALEELDLSNDEVTDSGLAYLRAQPGLRIVNLGGTQVTDQGIAALEEASPKVTITRVATGFGPARAARHVRDPARSPMLLDSAHPSIDFPPSPCPAPIRAGTPESN